MMKLYLVSDEQLNEILHGSMEEHENALETVLSRQEVTVERAIKALNSTEAAMNETVSNQ